MRVKMIPHITRLGDATSGIARVVEGYFRHLGEFGIELVEPDSAKFDLLASHAGMSAELKPDICHSHGWYWVADYDAKEWEWKTNIKVTESARNARVITVPSDWVAESVRRDMHIDPFVINHGIEYSEWSHNYPSEGYVLWNKNRTGDVCDIDPLSFLASRFTHTDFVSTFKPDATLHNISVTGVVKPQVMKEIVQKAGVYLATTKETFGIGTLEALASGVPVLGFAHGGTLDIVEHGVDGYLAPVGDYNALADGLRYCLEHRAILGANGRELVKKWTWEAACEKVARAYEQALVPDPPTVAVIIPTYNYAHLVGGAIQSALDQFYPHLLDIIIVDDGSPDNGATERAVAPFTEKDKRVRYIRQPNAGVANARNLGISLTNAKYICCLDADDSIAPTFLDKLIPPMEADCSLGLTYSGLAIVSRDGESVSEAEWPHDCDYDRQLQGDNQVPTCCVFRREIWKRLGGYRQRYAPHGCGTEDAEFWLRIGSIGYDMRKVTNEALFYYRMGGSTTSGRVAGTEWLTWHPWTHDNQHPFASIATPAYHSHPVRQYDEPLISVIIPVGPGHEHHVIDALDSLEAQTLRQWEAIIVWDSPEPVTIMDAFPFVRLIETGGGMGAGYSRNVGADNARAPFLLFLDADDYLFPNALSRMMVAFGESGDNGAIIYSDSHGHMIVDATQAEQFKRKDELIYYDTRTQLATIANRPEPYDYDKAVRQPDPRSPYFWCYISSLVPRLWHYEVGGFDETLPAWEDWDYWLRLARLGKPFVLVTEPLLVYRYYSGQRREAGRSIKKELMDHLVDKFKEIEIMPCRGCRQRRGTRPVTATVPVRETRTGVPGARTADADMVRVLYTHPNRGQHKVVGPITKTFYGYRGGGEEFYVHRRDMEAMPQWFKEVREAPRQVVITPEVGEAVKPPPPKLVGEAKPVTPLKVVNEKVHKDAADMTYQDFLNSMQEKVEPEPTAHSYDTPPPQQPMTIDRLPGITPAIADQLSDDGITDPKQLLELTIDELQKYKGVGPVKAEMILETVKEFMSETD